jgi:ribosome-binding factor A
MSELKENKKKEILRELAADFFSRESNRTSLITITDVDLNSRAKKATILISVLPVDKEQNAVEFIHRRLGDFRQYVMDNSRIAFVPFFDVKIDIGEKNRQRIDEIAEKV